MEQPSPRRKRAFVTHRPRVLRLTSESQLISARTFEDVFSHHLSDFIDVQPGDVEAFLGGIVGHRGRRASDPQTHERFRAATAGDDFISVDYAGLISLPLIARIRNRAGARVRLLLIAHAPAAYPLDWAVLRLLFRPGDRIVAPTESARAIITCLCPDLASFIRVIPHPIIGSRDLLSPEPRMTFLGRVVPGKLLHRLLDAHALLRKRGVDLSLDIAGPLGTGEISSYARTLGARVARLGIENHVRFHGLVDGRRKSRLLAGSSVLVNLSLSLEESFGKSIAEALAHGVPAVVTAWDGLPEVAGPVGIAVPVVELPYAMDVDADAVANAIERVLEHRPDAEACREAANRFSPYLVGSAYRQALSEALDELSLQSPSCDDEPSASEPAAPPSGLLASTAPLNSYSWTELYEAVVEESDHLRRQPCGISPLNLTEGGHLRTRVFYGLRRQLERLFAGLEPVLEEPASHIESCGQCLGASFYERIEAASNDPAATRSSRVVCLDLLWTNGHFEAVRRGLATLRGEGAASLGMQYLEVESLAQQNSIGAALEYCLQQDEPGLWDEHAAHRLEQLARLAIGSGSPQRALPRLRAWTERFPDEPEAGKVWLSRSLCAAEAGIASEALDCLDAATRLLGPALPEQLKLPPERP